MAAAGNAATARSALSAMTPRGMMGGAYPLRRFTNRGKRRIV